MKKNSYLILLSLLVAGCAQKEKQKSTGTVAANTSEIVTNTNYSMAGCRQMIIDKDTAYIALQESGDSLYGTLEYKRFEKDSNKGKIHLLKKTGRAEGWYNFQSEGMNSVRQIILKLRGDSLSEAYGDIVMRSDTVMFKYPHALQFEEKHCYIKVNCK